jgi:predicted ATPase
MKNENGKTLDCLLGAPLEPGQWLRLALGITAALAKLHKQNIIHKNINPCNIHVVPETGTAMIGCSPAELNALRELAYMSPEQTGRMNRSVDCRSDLYSLGVVFYQMLTGELPFHAVDALDWVHSHIARVPRPPVEINPEIPRPLSDIVIKLLAKAAEDRYQTASGLLADLATCRDRWESGRVIEPFPLGKEDISDRLLIPQKLYGREKDIDVLRNMFNRVAGQGLPEAVMIAGYSGIGKTAIVRELYKTIARADGFFISGKFDQYNLNIPYATIADAFRGLIRQILTMSEERISVWRDRLRRSLGMNGRIITDIIPEVELIIGRQPGVPDVTPSEAQNRFNLVFRQFAGAFTGKEHPLVVFLDDLQWVDSASLKLIEHIITHPGTRFFLLIGAYRDNMVGPGHPLLSALEEIGKQLPGLHAVTLSPLSFDDLGRLMADAFRSDQARIEPLTRLIHEKTAGNPFFAIQFLMTLSTERLVVFDAEKRAWSWDLERIRTKAYADNVVDLMADKLKRLRAGTRQMLTLAACIGSRFDLHTLSMIGNAADEDTRAVLDEGMREGLLLPAPDGTYTFLHDRVQQAAYLLTPVEERAAVHLRIGRILLRRADSKTLEDRVFDIVNQLNLGAELIADRNEQSRAAELNLLAGKKAKSSTAYGPAYNYFKAGLRYLGESQWHPRYRLALSLHEETAETACLCGDFNESERLVTIILQRAGTELDKVKAYETKINASIAQQKLLSAITAGLQILRLLGLRLPERPSRAYVLFSLLKTVFISARKWKGKRIDNLMDLPEMSNPVDLAKMRILEALGSPTYLARPELMPPVVLQGFNLSIRRGNSPESPFFYAAYGFLLCAAIGDIDAGYRFGALALKLVEHPNAVKWKARVAFLFNNFVRHSKEHLRETIGPLMEAHRHGLETGDFEYAARALLNHAYHLYFSGEDLHRVNGVMEAASMQIGALRQGTPQTYNQIFHQTVSNLLGETDDACSLIGGHFDERKALPAFLESKDIYAASTVYYNRFFLCYLFREYRQAVHLARKVDLNAIIALYYFYQFHCYDSLARLAVFRDVPAAEQRSILSKVASNQKKLKK